MPPAVTEVRPFALPDLGEGLTEADVVAWHVAAGDEVTLNQVLVEVETEKAVVELPSPFAGRVVELLADAGDTVRVGAPLVLVDTAAVEDAPPEQVPMLVGYGPSQAPPSRRRRRHNGSGHRDRAGGAPPAAATRPLAAPPVRFMARQNGIDLADVTGHGPGGIITREDLAAHLVGPPGGDGGAGTGRETRAPVRGVQRHMAEAMVRSVATAPQACVFLTVDVTATMELIEHLRHNRRFEGLHVTLLAVVARAVVLALRDHPSLNTAWDGATSEVVTKHYLHLGIAVAGPAAWSCPTSRMRRT